MRLKKIVHTKMLGIDDIVTEQIIIHFQIRGIPARLNSPLPDEWDALSRQEKIIWSRQRLDEHLLTNDYGTVGDVIWPDTSAPENAVDDMRQLPGWAAWTGQEASQWIEDNVIDLSSAKSTLKLMAMAIIYLRDMVLEK